MSDVKSNVMPPPPNTSLGTRDMYRALLVEEDVSKIVETAMMLTLVFDRWVASSLLLQIEQTIVDILSKLEDIGKIEDQSSTLVVARG